MLKNIFFIFFVNTLFLFPLFTFAQEKGQIELELNFGGIQTYNQSSLNSLTSNQISWLTTKETTLRTHQYGIAASYHLSKKSAIKLGFGNFQNGRTLSVIQTIFDDTFTTPRIDSLEGVKNKYHYRYLSLSHVFKVDFIYDSKFEIQNGLMILKYYDFLKTKFFLSKDYNFQYVLKLGISKRIKNRFKTSIRSTVFYGLQNFTLPNIEKGFAPFSVGGEIAISYFIN